MDPMNSTSILGVGPAMQAPESNRLQVGKYYLTPLTSVRHDDIPSLVGHGPGVYVSHCAEPAWYQHFRFRQNSHQHTPHKKLAMFANLSPHSVWISATPAPTGFRTTTWKSARILHLGTGPFQGRMAQLWQTAGLLDWLVRNRDKYGFIVVYNFYLPFYLGPLLAKLALRKKLYVEYEDDYTTVRKSNFKNFIERLLRTTVTGAICINEHMARYFLGKPVRVTNGFADLSYTASVDFNLRDGMTFLFGGTLDLIRGVDLVPQLVTALRSRIDGFRVLITGIGPLKAEVESWSIPEVRYCGLLDDASYIDAVKNADACLVLQKPDHPFSRGSFPSKIDEYARHKKPIFVLELPSR